MSIRGRRIALFTGNYNHIADGVSLTLNRLVAFMIEEGADIRIFAPTIKNPALEHAGQLVPVKSIAAPGRPEYRVALGLDRKAKKVLEEFEPEVVHIATPDILGRSALRWAKQRYLPVLATYHTHFASYLDYYKMGFLEKGLWANLRKFYDKCDATYVPSQSMIEVLNQHGLRHNLSVWARGIEQDRFGPEHRSDSFRARYGIQKEDVVVCFISRLVAEKGLSVLAQVAEDLEHQGIAHKCLVVGDGPARKDLEKDMNEAIFTGKLFGEELSQAYASSDIFLFPSESETFGNVTLEAMASGLPCVVADATGSKSLVVSGESGFLARPRDSDQFFEYTRDLILDRKLREKMGRKAQEKSLEFSWDAILAQMKDNYVALLPH